VSFALKPRKKHFSNPGGGGLDGLKSFLTPSRTLARISASGPSGLISKETPCPSRLQDTRQPNPLLSGRKKQRKRALVKLPGSEWRIWRTHARVAGGGTGKSDRA
jgi:hypothetical protein